MKTWIIPILIFLIIVPIIIFPASPVHRLFLQYISSFFTWPFVILILGLIFVLKFKDQISEFIKERAVRVITRSGNIYEVLPFTQEIEKFNEDKIKDELKNKDESLKLAIEMSIFERVIRHTYRSQFRLLKHLKDSPISLKVAVNYYSEYLRYGGNKNYEFFQYMNWLEDTLGFIKFIKKDDSPIFELTERGSRFIWYCNFMGYSENDFMPL